MNVERLLQIHVAALTSIGCLLLSMGQQDALLPSLGIFAAITSVVFTDVLGWFSLHRAVSNVTAVVALFVSLRGFLDTDTRGQLTAIAALLIYMQVALLYQRKTPRVYWQLALLSLLQVVVAAALNVRFEFGVLLVVYAAVAISTVTFLFVHRELLSVAGTAAPRPARRRKPATLLPSPEADASARLLDRTPRVEVAAVTDPPRQPIVGWGLVRQLAGLVLATFVFALVLFFAAPRLDSSTRRAWNVRAQHVVGFSSEVSLGAMNEVLQSDETVLRISFKEARKNQPYRVYGEPYLRGSVLTSYFWDGQEGHWAQPSRFWSPRLHAMDAALARRLVLPPWARVGSSSGLRTISPPPEMTLVRQEISLEPLEESVLFGVFPLYSLPDTPPGLVCQPITEQLSRTTGRDAEHRGEFRYALVTTGLRGGLQIDATPHANRLRTPADRGLLEWEQNLLLQFPAERFPRLQEIADQLVREQHVPPGDHVAVARALRNHFQAPGRYTYSLDFRQLPRRRELDPIEDFVAHHHTGHCAYFASALAMMLRSQGVPSRLVVGFKCDNYNAVGGYYQVLQRHAHAWVEAYLEPEQVAGVVPPGSDLSPGGGWLRLDPTPAADPDKIKQWEKGFMGYIDDGLDYARTVWSDYILGLTAKRQQEAIYDAVAEKTDPHTWSKIMDGAADWRTTVVGTLAAGARDWGWVVLLLTVAVAVGLGLRWRKVCSGVRAVLHAVLHWIARRAGWSAGAGRRRCQPVVEFYRRFENLLAQHGRARPTGKTPREFTTDFLAERKAAGTTSLAPLAETIVAAYYRVRFGQVPLEEAEARRLDDALQSLEQWLAADQNSNALVSH